APPSVTGIKKGHGDKTSSLRPRTSDQRIPDHGERSSTRRPRLVTGALPRTTDNGQRTTDTSFSIADLLDATVDDAIEVLTALGNSRHAQRALFGLRLLREVGLGYLRLGQPINTLSGGESQRLKLVGHLAEVVRSGQTRIDSSKTSRPGNPRPERSKPIL